MYRVDIVAKGGQAKWRQNLLIEFFEIEDFQSRYLFLGMICLSVSCASALLKQQLRPGFAIQQASEFFERFLCCVVCLPQQRKTLSITISTSNKIGVNPINPTTNKKKTHPTPEPTQTYTYTISRPLLKARGPCTHHPRLPTNHRSRFTNPPDAAS